MKPHVTYPCAHGVTNFCRICEEKRAVSIDELCDEPKGTFAKFCKQMDSEGGVDAVLARRAVAQPQPKCK